MNITTLKAEVIRAEQVTADYSGERVQIHHVFADGRLLVRSLEEHRESSEWIVDLSDLSELEVQF